MPHIFTPQQTEWLRRLRSGDFPQGKGQLTALDRTGHITGLCCLGVAAEMAVEQGIVVPVNREYTRAYKAPGGPERYTEAYVCPEPVMGWMGLRNNVGFLDGLPTDHTEDTLANRNDGGATFAQIAAAIEKNAEALFLPTDPD